MALIAHTCWSDTAVSADLLYLDKSVPYLYYSVKLISFEKEREGLVVLHRSRRSMARGWI